MRSPPVHKMPIFVRSPAFKARNHRLEAAPHRNSFRRPLSRHFVSTRSPDNRSRASQSNSQFKLRMELAGMSTRILAALMATSIRLPALFLPQTTCSTPSSSPGVTIQLTVQAEDGTGGHVHTDPGRPHGDFNPASGLVSPTDNLLHTVYTSPDVSGIVDATISGTLSNGTPCFPTTSRIGIETQGLVAVPASGTGYGTTPSVGHDSNNLFANPSVATNLQRLPVSFDILAQALITAGFISSQPIPTVTYTSLSLTYGGLFDVASLGTSITNPWHPPHCGHRAGTNADLRIKDIPAQFRPALIQSILDSHFTMPVKTENPSFPGATHWHLKAN